MQETAYYSNYGTEIERLASLDNFTLQVSREQALSLTTADLLSRTSSRGLGSNCNISNRSQKQSIGKIFLFAL